jgi:hypothetical protein
MKEFKIPELLKTKKIFKFGRKSKNRPKNWFLDNL